MFCKNCNNEINAKAEMCPNCGVRAKKDREGVVFGLLFGLIALIIGLLVYPAGSFQRKTFVRACIVGWVCSLVFTACIFIKYADFLAYYL